MPRRDEDWVRSGAGTKSSSSSVDKARLRADAINKSTHAFGAETSHAIAEFIEELNAHTIVAGGIGWTTEELSHITVMGMLNHLCPNGIRFNITNIYLEAGKRARRFKGELIDSVEEVTED